jgi:hypothetical protein
MSDSAPTFVICLRNAEHPASLERWKVYLRLPDERAAEANLMRVVDESGEDYLYPEAYFAPITLPREVEEARLAAA